MANLKFLIAILVVCMTLPGCESDVDAEFRIRSEIIQAVNKNEIRLGEEKIEEYRSRFYGWEYRDLTARLLIAKGDIESAKKELDICQSSECGSIQKKLKEKEYSGILTDGLDEKEYERFIEHFILDWGDKKVNKCAMLELIENEPALNNVTNKQVFSNIIREKIIIAGHDVYNKSGYTLPAYIKRTTFNVEKNNVAQNEGHMTMDEQAMIFQVAQIRGYSLGHKMSLPEFKPKNLAQLGAMSSRVFREDNESPCNYINRSLREKKLGSTEVVSLPNGERIFLNTSGIDFDKDVVQYHALISRYNDLFNKYEKIEEKIYLSENEVSDNPIPVVEVVR